MNLLLENIDEAKEDSEKVVKLSPNFGPGYAQKCYTDYRHAITKRTGNLIKEAMQKFEEAFEKFPDCSESYTLYAQVIMPANIFNQSALN